MLVQVAVGFGSCGLVIALHRPRNAVGWLFLAGALAHLATAAAGPWSYYGIEHGWPVPVLRLITCTGAFDATHHSYVDNLVVSAHLAD